MEIGAAMPKSKNHHRLFFLFDTEVAMDILEKRFQAKLIHEIKRRFPGCVVMKNDPNYWQGFPDLLILYGPHWAALECKRSASAKHQPNQDYLVKRLNGMSYASFVYPENKEKILDELQSAFRDNREACDVSAESAGLAELRQSETPRQISKYHRCGERNIAS